MKEKIESIIRNILLEKTDFDVTVPENPKFGHYSTNAALKFAKMESKNPVAFAGELIARIKTAAPHDFFEKIEIAGPGFINFWIKNEVFQDELKKIYKVKKAFGKSSIGKRKTVIVEYSQPNIAKRMHVGHLRTTILGDALANILETTGYKVIRWNYIGDWGTQFGKLIAAYKMWGSKDEVKKDPITTLLHLYVRFHDEVKKNPELEEQGRKEFKKLEEGDKENRTLWLWFKKESLKEFDKIYKLLGVSFDIDLGESFFEKDMTPLLAELKKKGIAKESDGAFIVPLENYGLPPALVQKSDHASLYLTRDIANIRYRIKQYKPAKILYVVGNEQTLHFEQLFAIAKILGIQGIEFAHIKYGLLLAEEGKKFATREGRAVFLDDVITEALSLAKEIVSSKNPDFSEKQKDTIAEAVAIGALKFAILKENKNSDIVFHWKQMLDFRGESAPYLQYTYARLRSILRKASLRTKVDMRMLIEENELTIIRKLVAFPDIIAESSKQYVTNNLAKYLYELANEVNRFYEQTPILKDGNAPRRNARLLLIETAATTLKCGLALLGIGILEKI